MGYDLVQKILPSLEKTQWPDAPEASLHGLQTYEIGLDKLAEYQGNPKTLMEALRVFQTTESAPYAYAGIAFTLLAAGAEKDGSYSQESLNTVMAWLEKAQALAPDVVEINLVEAYVYIYGNELENAQLVLEYLHGQDPNNYWVHVAEVAYWRVQGNVEAVEQATENATGMARTIPQKLRLRSQLADFYYEQGALDKALVMYQDAVHASQKDYMLWHKISVIYWKQENIEECERANQNTLRLVDYPPAKQLEAAIKKKKSESGGLGRIFGL